MTNNLFWGLARIDVPLLQNPLVRVPRTVVVLLRIDRQELGVVERRKFIVDASTEEIYNYYVCHPVNT